LVPLASPDGAVRETTPAWAADERNSDARIDRVDRLSMDVLDEG
jgi:hypothetical protein